MTQEHFSVGQISRGITIEGAEGQTIHARLSRSQRRNIARALYRKQKPRKVDPEEIGNGVAYRKQLATMQQKLIDDRAALEAEQEAAYMEAAKLR